MRLTFDDDNNICTIRISRNYPYKEYIDEILSDLRLFIYGSKLFNRSISHIY